MRSNVEIKEGIHWVGAVDWSVRDFHGYSTMKGTTYNAYLVMDEKVTLFDTVKHSFKNDLLHCIYKVIEPSKIDYLVVNHVEPDHSGSVAEMMEIIKPEKLICSARGKKALLDHYHREDWPYEVVSTGQEISLGKRTVQFIETRMLHWPDSMFSYLKEDAVLISSDAFGHHWATSERFNDQVNSSELMDHCKKYFANILLPYSSLIQKLIADVGKLGLKLDVIAPDHGVIWRENPMQIVAAYDQWSKQIPKRKALVIYDTMWNSTEKMAKAVADGLVEGGISTQLLDLRANHRSDVITELLEAKAVVLGSSTLNNGILPKMADMICYMKGLRPANKIGAAFGSFGWSGEAVRLLNTALEEMKVNVVHPGVSLQFVPKHEGLHQCVNMGRELAKIIKEKV
ncbi:MAG: flavodoxin domain-containing protein [Desulfomonile tiedjei]|uniref:Flavodoxin domain-containing protein n=1 Tax=Desulfomonile tiedjei TaxID=2358 RepID=A0A9D6V4B1_9BACT|nr:flavodoxin domain-containing protein [Desulfomonile tiedjei]